jgi:GNAT superfamily N-acetyltransferase
MRVQSGLRDFEFKYASTNDWSIIHAIAHKTWPVAYNESISTEQLNYMLEMIYSKSSIQAQMEIIKHVFYIGYHANMQFGFTSIEGHYKLNNQLMIHKLYVLPEFQGKGFGKAFINYITMLAIDTGHDILCLKVFHKNQRGIEFYKSMGFSVHGKEKTNFGDEYEIIDYVMVKKINR